MVETSFRRARSPEQIEQRRRQILRAATLILEEEGLHGVTLNGIARRVGLAKSNIYRYFESGGAIILELISGEWVDFADAVEGGLLQLAGRNDAEAVARVVASGFGSRPRFCELNKALWVVLDTGVSGETAREFKTTADEVGQRMAEVLHQALPRIGVNRCIWAVRIVHAVAAGLWPTAEWFPKVAGAPKGPQFDRPHGPFEDELESAVCALLFGLLVEAARESP
jgi:AcrR family transcriptional regulator